MKADFEKLGAFYLGKRFDAGSAEISDDLVLYDAKDLTTHAVCVGMTGSGKTGLCVTLLEEAAIDGVPALCIDPKGDLSNLCLTFPGLSPSEFLPWIDPAEAKRKGQSPEDYAASISQRWKEGLASWGQDGQRIAKLKQAAEVAVYTPGSHAARKLSVLSTFEVPPKTNAEDQEAFGDAVQGAVSSLLALINIEADPLQSREHILLSNIFSVAWKQGDSLSLAEIIRDVQKPPFSQVGVMDLESFFPAAERQKLAMRLNGLLASPDFALWVEGEPLDIQRLLWTESGKPRIVILSIAHLDDAERMFFVTRLLNEVVAWMRSQSGTSSLRALLYMDEVFGFLPPVANPASKKPMLTLLKQARAFGLGVVLATQNPVDIDYKALSNCGTWFLGRLQTERDVDRVIDGLKGAAASQGQSLNIEEVRTQLAGLKSRVFLMNNAHDDAPLLFHTRWAMSYLRGPLTRSQLKALTPAAPELSAVKESSPQKTAPKRSELKTQGSRPLVPPEINELFLDSDEGDYAPAVLAVAKVHHVRAKFGLDRWREVGLLTPLDAKTNGDVWAAAQEVQIDALDIVQEAPEGARFAELPPGVVSKKGFRALEKSAKAHIYQHFGATLFEHKKLKLRSEPDETRAEFVARARLAEREHRDAQVEKLRKRFAPKLAKMQERIHRAEQKVEREQSQYEQRKLDTAVSIGSTVLGAIFGRRSVSSASTAASRAGRVMAERGDIKRAEESLGRLQERLEEMEEEFQEVIDNLEDAQSDVEEVIEVISVPPRKSDISFDQFALAWRLG